MIHRGCMGSQSLKRRPTPNHLLYISAKTLPWLFQKAQFCIFLKLSFFRQRRATTWKMRSSTAAVLDSPIPSVVANYWLKIKFPPGLCESENYIVIFFSDCEEDEPPSQPSAIPFVFDNPINIQWILKFFTLCHCKISTHAGSPTQPEYWYLANLVDNSCWALVCGRFQIHLL